MSYIVEYSETVDDVELANEMDGELVGLDGTNIYSHLSVKRNKFYLYDCTEYFVFPNIPEVFRESVFRMHQCYCILYEFKNSFFSQRTTVSK